MFRRKKPASDTAEAYVARLRDELDAVQAQQNAEERRRREAQLQRYEYGEYKAMGPIHQDLRHQEIMRQLQMQMQQKQEAAAKPVYSLLTITKKDGTEEGLMVRMTPEEAADSLRDADTMAVMRTDEGTWLLNVTNIDKVYIVKVSTDE